MSSAIRNCYIRSKKQDTELFMWKTLRFVYRIYMHTRVEKEQESTTKSQQ